MIHAGTFADVTGSNLSGSGLRQRVADLNGQMSAAIRNGQEVRMVRTADDGSEAVQPVTLNADRRLVGEIGNPVSASAAVAKGTRFEVSVPLAQSSPTLPAQAPGDTLPLPGGNTPATTAGPGDSTSVPAPRAAGTTPDASAVSGEPQAEGSTDLGPSDHHTALADLVNRGEPSDHPDGNPSTSFQVLSRV